MIKKILWCTIALLLAGIVLFSCSANRGTGGTGGSGTGAVTGTGGSPSTGGTTGTGGAAPTGTGTGTAQTPGSSDVARPAEGEGNVDDVALTNAIRNKLDSEGITATDVQVEVENGDVTLSGKVGDQSTADRIVQIVKTVENVHDVHSNLEVGQQ